MKLSELSIRESIHQGVLNKEKKKYKGIHASALGSCFRTHFYHIKGLEETTPPNLGALMNFKMGDVWEETLFPLMSEIDGAKVIHHKGEDWSIKELNLYGTPDFSVECEDGKIIVDSKTVSKDWFWNQEKSYKLVADKMTMEEFLLRENHSYAIQQGCYLMMARSKGLKYDHARLVFVNKDNSFIGWEVKIYLTAELEKEIMERISYLNKCLKENKVPRCECAGWKIGYCNYGTVETRKLNTKKKEVNTECCDHHYIKEFNTKLKEKENANIKG